METDNGGQKLVTVDEEVRKFTGTTVEELCFTIDCFNTTAEDLEILEENLKTEFQKVSTLCIYFWMCSCALDEIKIRT